MVQGGGEVVGSDSEAADALVWDSFTMDGVLDALGAHPGVRWVQLPMAGVERFFEAGIFASPQASGVTWTCAKGSYARPVAEHALLPGPGRPAPVARTCPRPIVGTASRDLRFSRRK